jgi:hypothetical protein
MHDDPRQRAGLQPRRRIGRSQRVFRIGRHWITGLCCQEKKRLPRAGAFFGLAKREASVADAARVSGGRASRHLQRSTAHATCRYGAALWRVTMPHAVVLKRKSPARFPARAHFVSFNFINSLIRAIASTKTDGLKCFECRLCGPGSMRCLRNRDIHLAFQGLSPAAGSTPIQFPPRMSMPRR